MKAIHLVAGINDVAQIARPSKCLDICPFIEASRADIASKSSQVESLLSKRQPHLH
jgi:hypothetical protein